MKAAVAGLVGASAAGLAGASGADAVAAPLLAGLAAAAFALLMIAAAVIDARERRLPNALAAALAGVGAVCALVQGGLQGLLRNAAAALLACGFLLGFELAWRRLRGMPGQGMGDIKALFAVLLACPEAGVLAYMLGMAGLAVAGIAMRSRSLPFLPFFAVALAVAFVGLIALASPEAAGYAAGI